MDVRSVLKLHGVRPSKGLGQNLLVDPTIVSTILQASELSPADVVLEVGPGVGVLTVSLAELAGQVIAVELDRKMVAILRDTLHSHRNVHVLQQDILQLDVPHELSRLLGLADVGALRYKVVANLPYYITSAALRHLLAAKPLPTQLTVMVQYEVAQRILAEPGDLSLLAISVQVFGKPELISKVPAGAFYPAPKVDSAVLRVRIHAEPRVPENEQAWFFRVAQAGFSQKRKQVHNGLRQGLALSRACVEQALLLAGIAGERRPQTLSIEEWLRLARVLPPTPA